MTDAQDPATPPRDEPQLDPTQEPAITPEPAVDPEQVATPEAGVAEGPTLAQELAELVRERTRAEAKLTPLDIVETEGEILSREQQEELVAQMAADEACQDIQVMRTSAGAILLYSSQHMTDAYAQILLRVADGNPYEQIAVPVREHSKIYPRPTSLEELKDSAYGLDPERLRVLVDEMLQMEQYADIKLVTASTGALYLYSEQHLTAPHAESLVHWQEVERYENP
jgi:hypothetical protein